MSANGAVLAQLMAQAQAGGAATAGVDLATLRGIAEEAGELAASRALARLGLDDRQAARDMAELRELLGAWREAKTSLWKAVLGWLARSLLVVVLAGLAVKLGVWELAR